MSHLELAAILRAKAWRNYPGVFAAPETHQERTAQAVQAGHWTDSNIGNQAFVDYTADYFFYAADQ